MDLDSVSLREMTLRMLDAGVSVYIDEGTVVTVSGAKSTYVGAFGAAGAAASTGGAAADVAAAAVGAAAGEGAGTGAESLDAQPSLPKN